MWLGLPMPRVEVIDVSDWLIEHTDDLRVELNGSRIPCSSGRQLASLYAGDKIEATILTIFPTVRFSRSSISTTSRES